MPRKLLLGNGPRSAMFSGMTGLDFHAWDGIVDILLVKHYFWHRGFDGMYGTVARWIKQIAAWNPELTEEDCWTVLRAWMGIELPEVESLADLELGFPQAFFDEVVQRETRRALAAVEDPGKIMPWVDTGRMPHDGDPMTAGDLQRILAASRGGRAEAIPLPQPRPPDRRRMGGHLANVRTRVGRKPRRLLAAGDAETLLVPTGAAPMTILKLPVRWVRPAGQLQRTAVRRRKGTASPP